MDYFLIYLPQFDLFLLGVGFAFSQQIVLRAGVFSIATAGLASIGAYCVAILVQRHGMHPLPAVVLGTVLGALAAALLAVPLARLRGVYQAIATLAFVQIVLTLTLYAEPLTGGAMGINNIPKSVGTWHLLVAVGLVMYVMYAIDRSGIGRVFDAIRQDETVGATLGVSVSYYHMLAFIISGALGGLFGGLQSLYVYSIEPEMFGFSMLTAVLAYIILGGRGTVLGPIVGTAILTALPELARPLADYRPLFHGLLIMLMIAFLPHGVVDGAVLALRQRRAVKGKPASTEKAHVVAGT
jgi:branched-chain amino acid transport system permease protein